MADGWCRFGRVGGGLRLCAVQLLVCLPVLVACGEGRPAPSPVPSPSGATVTPATPVAQVSPIAGTPQAPDITEGERALLYARVVLDLLTEEQARHVYISPYVAAGERLDVPDEHIPLPQGLVDLLLGADPARTYEISAFEDAVGPLDDGGQVRDGGVFITLGQIQLQRSGGQASGTGVLVRASIYRRVGSAEGYIYRFDRDPSGPDGWKLVESTLEWSD